MKGKVTIFGQVALLVLAVCLIALYPGMSASTLASGHGAQPIQQGGPAGTAPQVSVGGAFTYQGQLKQGGNPANGHFDFTFKLYKALSGGSQAGSTVTVLNQNVVSGLFTVQLDFNGSAFAYDGTARWLEIAVRPAGAGAYTTLAPRQPLTPAPFAIGFGDAIGHSLYISTTAGIAGTFETRSGGEAVYAECLQSGNNCFAVEGYAPTGDYAGYFYGGKGVYAESDDASQPGLDANAYAGSAYAVRAESSLYRGGYFKTDVTTNYSLYVDTQGGPSQVTAGLNVRGTIRGEGNLVIAGSKAGYVVDIMQNAGTEALEAGDVVTIVGSSAPVLGQIPVALVKKSSTAYDTGVAGVVDEVVYVPDAATRAAYDKQEADMRAAMQLHDQAIADANAKGPKSKPDLSNIVMPEMTITDEQGTMHADPKAVKALPNGYANVVTLGSYKGVKVDASFGPVHAGDLLVASPHAGYAMKASDRSQASGATIGKALGSLEAGTGMLPVLVTLK